LIKETANIIKKAIMIGLDQLVKSLLLLIAKKLNPPKRAAVMKKAFPTIVAPPAIPRMWLSKGVMMTPLANVKTNSPIMFTPGLFLIICSPNIPKSIQGMAIHQ